jgi:ATP-dependent exoDNAse (exonuclease V) beta subunit
VFVEDDGSGVRFSAAEPARAVEQDGGQAFRLNLAFVPRSAGRSRSGVAKQAENEAAKAAQIEQIVELIRAHQARMAAASAAGQKYRIAVLARTRASLVPIAAALREAAIPFRAVDLEQLGERPEVLDALALGRALLNREDRVAWLGVLRAPWCGLTLDDLHRLTSADDPALLARPVPELLAERLSLLSDAGRMAAERVLAAVAQGPVLRTSLPTATAGTLLEQIWLSLGGADCCDRTARANLDLLWSCLDRLPAGEQDLVGPALTAALDKLTALPDPAASSDCGMQLMTIHRSKGLEFEVVFVPDLQAKTRGASKKLLSWLERGVEPGSEDEAADTHAITEFLVAPLPSKGTDSGQAKLWVDRVCRERESQEMRRILYVAATRARDELHLFARAGYKTDASGEMTLSEPVESLLKTAWPGLEAEVGAQFEAWKAARQAEATESAETDAEIESIAASGELIAMPGMRPTQLRRLRADYVAPPLPGLAMVAAANGLREAAASLLYIRHEGGAVSRALGTAVHALFEELARLRASANWEAACAQLKGFEPRIAAQARAAGLVPAQATRVAADALRLTLSAAGDPVAQWILAPHPEAESEANWTGVVDGRLTGVRVDRVFRAGLEAQAEGTAAWWIVDLKTAHPADVDAAAALPELRRLFAPQLEAYAHILRNLHGTDAVIRAGLYYPRMLALDWWEL